MDSAYQARIDLFVRNVEMAKRGFTWHNALPRRLAALLYAAESQPFDADSVRGCYDSIKASTGIFSTFRGNSALSISAMLALSPDPQKLLGDVLDVYERMKRAGFRSSDYLTVASFLIAQQANAPRPNGGGADRVAGAGPDPRDTDVLMRGWRDASELDRASVAVQRARAFYDGMKSGHWFITGQDDYIFAAMLGLSDLEVDSGVLRVERFYEDLHPDFWDRNSVQALAQVLALGGDPDRLPRRVRDLNEGFRASGVRLDRSYTLSTLGVLALLPQDKDLIVHEVGYAYDYLREQPGFGGWSVAKHEVLLYAASLFALESAAEIRQGLLQSTLTTSITSIIIAQQASMAAAVAASSAAAASSAGSH